MIFDDCAILQLMKKLMKWLWQLQKDDNDGLYDVRSVNTPPVAIINSDGCADSDNDDVLIHLIYAQKPPQVLKPMKTCNFKRDSDGDGVTDDLINAQIQLM